MFRKLAYCLAVLFMLSGIAALAEDQPQQAQPAPANTACAAGSYWNGYACVPNGISPYGYGIVPSQYVYPDDSICPRTFTYNGIKYCSFTSEYVPAPKSPIEIAADVTTRLGTMYFVRTSNGRLYASPSYDAFYKEMVANGHITQQAADRQNQNQIVVKPSDSGGANAGILVQTKTGASEVVGGDFVLYRPEVVLPKNINRPPVGNYQLSLHGDVAVGSTADPSIAIPAANASVEVSGGNPILRPNDAMYLDYVLPQFLARLRDSYEDRAFLGASYDRNLMIDRAGRGMVYGGVSIGNHPNVPGVNSEEGWTLRALLEAGAQSSSGQALPFLQAALEAKGVYCPFTDATKQQAFCLNGRLKPSAGALQAALEESLGADYLRQLSNDSTKPVILDVGVQGTGVEQLDLAGGHNGAAALIGAKLAL